MGARCHGRSVGPVFVSRWLRRRWPRQRQRLRAQVELKTYMDDKGYLNVRALTCAQLANTYQEDADFLGAWYSGWWNGHMKRHSINVARTKQGIHEVIVYCKANPDAKVVDAVDAYVKKVQAGGQ